jgi:uncharacterized protein YukE
MEMASSGGGGIRVDPEALTNSAPRLLRSAGTVRDVSGSVSGTGCIDLGDGPLGAALDTFTMKWSTLTGHAADAVQQLSQTIGSAAASYEAVDTSVMPGMRP